MTRIRLPSSSIRPILPQSGELECRRDEGLLLLGGEASQRRCERAAGVGGRDDLVDVAALGGGRRGREPVVVLAHELGVLGAARLLVGDRRRGACRAGSAPRRWRPSRRSRRPAMRRTSRSRGAFESITMYAPPYALRSTTHSLGTVAAAYACTSCAPCRIMPRHSRSVPGSNPGVSTNVSERHVERVAPLHEPRALAGRVDVERPGALARLVRDDADRPSAEPGERGHEVRCMAGAQLEEAAGVDDVADHVAHVVRQRSTRSAPPPRRRVQSRSSGSGSGIHGGSSR